VHCGSNTLIPATRSKITPADRLTVVEGDVRNARALAEAMRGTDAVVSTLGLGKVRDPGNLIADSTRALVRAAEDSETPDGRRRDRGAAHR
jgi:putative NADH-flavin reductase